MKKRGAVRLLLNLTICALAFPLSDASALSQNDNSENIAEDAMKMPEAQLTRIQPSPKYTPFSGNATGYGSGLRYRGASKYVTHYVSGKSGSDGIHYNSEEAKEWANRVARELDRMLR
jgi:hypothetical protein